MTHRLWPFTDRLVAKMADSSLNDDPSTVGTLVRPPLASARGCVRTVGKKTLRALSLVEVTSVGA
jgi:hypothetical protein